MMIFGFWIRNGSEEGPTFDRFSHRDIYRLCASAVCAGAGAITVTNVMPVVS
jgi:hypothetical protein